MDPKSQVFQDMLANNSKVDSKTELALLKGTTVANLFGMEEDGHPTPISGDYILQWA